MYKVHQHTLAFTGTIFSAFALTGSLTGSYWLPLPPPQEPTPIGADSTHHAPLLKIVSGSCRCPATLALPLRSCRAAQHLAKVGGTWVGNLFGAHSLSPARQLSCYSTSPFSYSSILLSSLILTLPRQVKHELHFSLGSKRRIFRDTPKLNLIPTSSLIPDPLQFHSTSRRILPQEKKTKKPRNCHFLSPRLSRTRSQTPFYRSIQHSLS